MKKITKAIIPAAGLGTRMLPISRAVCKEMLPIVDRPAISYLVEEAKNSGITDILIIESRGKSEIENYFDITPEYESALSAKGQYDNIASMRREFEGINIFFTRQHKCEGLGQAVLYAEGFTKDEPFAVLYGDDIVFSKTPVVKQLISAYEKTGKGVAGVKQVERSLLKKYCSLKVGQEENGVYPVYDMIEKPQSENEMFSNFAILGRVILTPDIFPILRATKAGFGGELQLTDAMKTLARSVGMCAVEFEGDRYDLGSKIGLIKANIVKALEHPETKDEIKEFLKNLEI